MKHEGMLSHLGFNSDCEAPVYITQEVAKELAEQIQEGFKDYQPKMDFSGGNSSKRKASRSTRNKISSS